MFWLIRVGSCISTQWRCFQTFSSNCNSELALCRRTYFSCTVTSVYEVVFEFLGPLTGSDRGQTHCQVYLKKHHLTPFNGPPLARGPPVHPPPLSSPQHYSRHSWSIPPSLKTFSRTLAWTPVVFTSCTRAGEIEVLSVGDKSWVGSMRRREQAAVFHF